MIIAWKGKGFLVPVIFLGNVAISANIDIPGEQSNALFATSCLLTTWLPGISFNRKNAYFSMSEAYWGLSAPHTFLFIPFQYWGLFAPVSLVIKAFS
jgi:hypothetical protein